MSRRNIVLSVVTASLVCLLAYGATKVKQTVNGTLVVTGSLQIADGSVSQPSLALSSDADGQGTGLYRVTNNQLGVTTDGALKLTIAPSAITSTVQILTGSLNASTQLVGKGTVVGDTATEGVIGESKQCTSLVDANFGTSNQYKTVCSISLTAGDWDIYGLIKISANGATVTLLDFGIGTADGNSSAGMNGGENAVFPTLPGTGYTSAAIPGYQVNITSTTSYYLKIYGTYSVATPQYNGRMSARRVR